MYTDEQLISFVLAGKEQMYREIVIRYQHKVFSASIKFANNHSDAEDIAQEVFLQAYKSLDTFRFDSKFSTWLYRITVNKCLDWKRKNKNLLETGEFNEQITQKFTMDLFLEDSILQKEQEEQLKNVIAELPEVYQSVITLYYFDNLSYQDIANKLNVAKKTVESRLYRGKQMLKEINVKEDIK